MSDPAANRSGTPGDAARRIPTVRLAAATGADAVATFDPTEDYHEASRMYARAADPAVVGAARLERSLDMRVSATRSVKRHSQFPRVPLPARELGATSLAAALDNRRSVRVFAERPLRLAELGSVLQAGYGVTGTLEHAPQELRSAPSGGALYPLELYVVVLRVDGVEPALYHYDPLRDCLERLGGESSAAALDAVSPYGELLRSSAAFVAITAMFWRSRFKYGARAYRFALLEAGHVAQNMLLASTVLGLAAVPIGGFFDRDVDALLGLDGLYEAALYLLPLGATR